MLSLPLFMQPPEVSNPVFQVIDSPLDSINFLEIKLDVRNDLRALLEARETARIQADAVRLAKRRVASTELFLQAGRAEVRDVLESEESLLNAQNALTAALVQYRVAELEIQRDLGLLQVDEKGVWAEYTPGEPVDDNS